jgi:cytochrome c biogenesis protein CcdA
MLLVVLTYIGLYQRPLDGFLTMLIYSIGLSIPLFIISSAGGAIGNKIKGILSKSGELTDMAIGITIILIGLNFIYLAFA